MNQLTQTRNRRPWCRLAYPIAVFCLFFLMGISGITLSAETASVVARGGVLYDNWVKAAGMASPSTPHPAYPSDKKYANKPEANWRCKECHGWDYRGKDGAYSKGKHATGIVGISQAKGKGESEIIRILADGNHGYDKYLNKDDLHALALFVNEGQMEMDRFIDRASNRPFGNAGRGEAYFNTVCAKCHGSDGLQPKEMAPLGALVSSNPWEVMHKIANGQPDENMPALRAFDNQVIADIMAYMTALPKKR